jgi:hypothetical protein
MMRAARIASFLKERGESASERPQMSKGRTEPCHVQRREKGKEIRVSSFVAGKREEMGSVR